MKLDANGPVFEEKDRHNCLDHLLVSDMSLQLRSTVFLEVHLLCGFSWCTRTFVKVLSNPGFEVAEAVIKYQEERTKVSLQTIDDEIRLIPSAVAPPRYERPPLGE